LFKLCSLTFWCFNVHSIVNKRLDFLAKLSTLTPGIVLITETYLDNTITDSEIFPPNYTVHRLDRNRHGGGVLIAVLDTFPSVACPDYGRAGVELLWIRLVISGKPTILGVLYRPPNFPDSCQLELQSSLSTLPPTAPILLCGDLNLSGIDWQTPSVNHSVITIQINIQLY